MLTSQEKKRIVQEWQAAIETLKQADPLSLAARNAEGTILKLQRTAPYMHAWEEFEELTR